MQRIKAFIKKETVFCVAAVLTVLSACIVPPSFDYIGYIDFSVLAMLFCLMAVVAGFRKAGVFESLSEAMLRHTQNEKSLGIALVGICFLCSMFVTNDVTLITFVPFTISVLRFSGQKNLAFVVVMETISANLGSMMTPIGNPQNLFLYRFYEMSFGSFSSAVFPLGLASMVLITAILLLRKQGKPIRFSDPGTVRVDQPRLLLYLILLAVCLLTVLHILDYRITLALVCAVLFLRDRDIFPNIDYMLLWTFVCFFLFVGNLSRIPAVESAVASLLSGRELLLSALLSQVISNVPAAVMLAPFTENAAALLRGVNIGGLGTLIASFASLISYKYYTSQEDAKTGSYLLLFTGYNFGLFLILYLLTFFL